MVTVICEIDMLFDFDNLGNGVVGVFRDYVRVREGILEEGIRGRIWERGGLRKRER